ncbi:uncharacterized protein [Drosophila pseudoobscura]|uniref:Uncharacterized protein n=1 Tax=Drosophila pseudoobscura pseudoobscura TaxID=46245 RepID=B5DNX1_DROPS|nr:uncharacterized protein LOC6901121 [Drosophila pseudoobscura]
MALDGLSAIECQALKCHNLIKLANKELVIVKDKTALIYADLSPEVKEKAKKKDAGSSKKQQESSGSVPFKMQSYDNDTPRVQTNVSSPFKLQVTCTGLSQDAQDAGH